MIPAPRSGAEYLICFMYDRIMLNYEERKKIEMTGTNLLVEKIFALIICELQNCFVSLHL